MVIKVQELHAGQAPSSCQRRLHLHLLPLDIDQQTILASNEQLTTVQIMNFDSFSDVSHIFIVTVKKVHV